MVSCSQLSFPGDKHSAFQRNVDELSFLAKKWNFDLFVYNKDVIVADDARVAVKALESEKVDFVLVQTTSFSAGQLAPIFAKTKNARLGLWAIPEGAKDGAVPFNSFCGINMYSAIIGHYLDKDKVHFKWYFGNVNDPLFYERFRITVCALRAIKKMGESSVALIGGIAPGFDDLYDDERNLIRLFDGIKINRLHEYDEIKKLAEGMDATIVKERMEKEILDSNGFTHPTAQKMMEVNARYSLAYDAFIEKYGYNALAISCWPKFQEDYLYSVCAVVAELNDKGVVTSCEGDLTSAICMLLLKYISEDETMLMDMSAFDQEDNSILFWHCGPAGKRFCEKCGYKLGLNYSGWAHEPDEIEVSGTGTARDMVFDPGVVTIARLTGESDRLLVATAEMQDGNKPSFNGSRGWAGNLRLYGESISSLDFVNTILTERFQHHFPIVKGDWTKELLEVMSWLDLKKVSTVPYQDFMENPRWW